MGWINRSLNGDGEEFSCAGAIPIAGIEFARNSRVRRDQHRILLISQPKRAPPIERVFLAGFRRELDDLKLLAGLDGGGIGLPFLIGSGFHSSFLPHQGQWKISIPAMA